MMTIERLQQEFNWKAHGEDIAGNLNAGFKIYYTTDGTEPDANSSLYTDPFKMEKGELKAVAVLNRQKGAVHSELFGLIKQGWKPLDSNGGTGKRRCTKPLTLTRAPIGQVKRVPLSPSPLIWEKRILEWLRLYSTARTRERHDGKRRYPDQ